MAAKKKRRVKRPELPRRAPIRQMSGLFGAQTAESSAVERGVELGYRVVDEYVRQGRALAGALRRPENGAQTGAEPRPDMQRSAERMLQSASELASTWIDFVRAATAGARASVAPSAEPAHADERDEPRAEPLPATPPSLALEVSTEQRVDVRVQWQRPAKGPFVVHELRRVVGGRVRRLGSAEAVWAGDPDRLIVRLAIPPKSLKGAYSAAIIDTATNVTVGKLHVVIA